MDTHYINEVLKGNTHAFGYLIRTYQNKTFGIAISIVKNDEDAKDVVQESFITAYASLSSFRNDAKFSTWLYRIVVNKALQFLKRQKRKEEVSQEIAITENDKTAYNSALEQLNHQDLKLLVKKVLSEIPPREALILQLFYLENQQISEIQTITDFTKANIKVLLHRGRKSFYKKLKKDNITKPY
ncbi:RNA polymerase sigma factor [Maribacter aurantiacus]|uniref:RNA polymerase sigma factor n=1 Tax=Maribacter aurantiacus TaxID=1882343 RepID=A0A5R8M725_9FLAO|nr:RNA polymerase sigma factor [Maribacter aurantiacus]TLF45280.1 RNA polymerase sigma factor [Maribacter aurantiacus]